MTTIQLTYNEQNKVAKKAIEFLKTLNVFKFEETRNTSKERTLKAISDARSGKGVTQCATFEDYLKAVAE